MTDLAPLALACHAASLCAGKSAEDVAVLRLPAGGEFEYVVLATARSERQAYTLVDEVFGFCKRRKIGHKNVEGEAGWYLLDCFQVVVHALGAEQRAYYNFEKLWKKAATVDWQAELAKLPALPELPPKGEAGPHLDEMGRPPTGDGGIESAQPMPPRSRRSTDGTEPGQRPGVVPKGRRGEAPDAE